MLSCCRTDSAKNSDTTYDITSRLKKMKYNRFNNNRAAAADPQVNKPNVSSENGEASRQSSPSTKAPPRKKATSPAAVTKKSRKRSRKSVTDEDDEEYLMHKCYLVFCLWRRNAIMSELQVDDPGDEALQQELQRQWSELTEDELTAYRRLASLLLSSASSCNHQQYYEDETL